MIESTGRSTIDLAGLQLQLKPAAVVAVSQPGETRWGRWQFPAISRLPDGCLLTTINDTGDADTEYGLPGPAFVSNDGGATWSAFTPDESMLAISHSVISEVNDGERLIVPMSPSPRVDPDALPPVVHEAQAYGVVRYYDLNGFSPALQAAAASLPASRWTPATQTWTREEVSLDMAQGMVRLRPGEMVMPRAYIDNRIVNWDGRLYYPDYHALHRLPYGSPPKHLVCWCLTSDDNGRSWGRRGLIAADGTGNLLMGEPTLSMTTRGDLACVIRTLDHRVGPLLITYSSDRGRTWTSPTKLFDYGVMPQSLLLDCGVMILVSGRPGVFLMCSPDGCAREWTAPISLVPAVSRATVPADSSTSAEPPATSCGYTRVLATGPNRFLVVYSVFDHHNADGMQSKAVMVREITVDS